MRFLCSAAFVLVSSIQANAMCVAGIGDSCPPSDAVIQQQIREQIDGKFLHNQRITTEIYKFNIPHGTIAPQAVDQMRSEIRNGLIPFTLSGQSCDGIAGFMPSVMKGQNYNVSSFANPCKNARRLSSAGIMTLDTSETDQWGTLTIVVFMKPTARGSTLIQETSVNRTGDPLANLEHWLQVKDLVVFTDKVSFGQIVRKSDPQAVGPATICQVQFSYRVVPNEWALSSVQDGQGTAVFQKWSDGWHLAGPPNL